MGWIIRVTSFVPSKDVIGYTKEELVGNVVASLGGRAAEDLVYGN